MNVDDEYPYLQSFWHVQLLALALAVSIIYVLGCGGCGFVSEVVFYMRPGIMTQSHVYETFD